MGWSASDIADLVTSTLESLGPPQWTDITTDWQELYALERLLKAKKVTVQDGGYAIRRQLQVDVGDNARFVKLHEVDNTNISDTMQTIQIPWRHAQYSYAIERREVLMNKSASEIFNLVKSRRIGDGLIPFAKMWEQAFWGTITDDGTTPFGVQYWIAWESSEGFYGANHASFSDGPGGLSASTYARWCNACYTYTNVSKLDLIKDWRTAYRKCSWKAPVKGIPTYEGDTFQRVNYCNHDTLQALEDVGEAQNENLGRDIAPMDDTISFKRTPIMYVPYLDDYSTSDPIWMIDWSVFEPVVLAGDYLNEYVEQHKAGQHNDVVTYVDITANWMCTNRRKLAVLAKADPASGI